MKPTIIKFFLIPKEYDTTFMHIYPELQANRPIEDAIEPIEISENEFNSNESDDNEEEEEERLLLRRNNLHRKHLHPRNLLVLTYLLSDLKVKITSVLRLKSLLKHN